MSGLLSAHCHTALPDTLPSTFEERGTTVPFTTKELLYSRIRRHQHGGLEILVNGFSGGRCTYVFPWHSIPQVVRLNLHDKALHAEITFSDATTPDKIRLAGYRVARTGLGGVDMIARANRALAEEADGKLATGYYLILKVIEATGVNTDRAALALTKVESSDGRLMVQSAFARMAAAIGSTPEICHQRIVELGDIIQPIGFEIKGQRGRLRTLLHRLTEFRDSVLREQSGTLGRLLADSIQLTVRIATTTFQEIDGDITNIVRFIKEWDDRAMATRRAIDRLSWLLDGWTDICDLWDGVDVTGAETKLDKRERLNEIMRIIPLVPRSEFGAAMRTETETVNRRQNRIVQQNQDWRTGRIDDDMMVRMGNSQARPDR